MSSSPRSSHHHLGLPALLALACISLAACATDSPKHDRNGLAEELPPPATSLTASGDFFNGQLHVVAHLSNGAINRSTRRGPGRGHATHRARYSENRSPEDGNSEDSTPSGMNPMGSSEPPLLLTLQLENRGAMPLEVTIRDIDSDLGNFVAQPEQLTLKPGESSKLEPMISRLGVLSEEIPLKLSFRSSGKIETQTVILRNTPSSEAEPSSP